MDMTCHDPCDGPTTLIVNVECWSCHRLIESAAVVFDCTMRVIDTESGSLIQPPTVADDRVVWCCDACRNGQRETWTVNQSATP